MKLKEFLRKNKFDAILFDASGVIYSDNGITPGATKTIKLSQEIASTYVVTNNSYSYPNYIHNHLKKAANVIINEDHIISSGHGLATDPEILNLITNKTVYFLGRDVSKQYILDAPIKTLTQTPENADVIVLANYTPSPNCTLLSTIINAANQNPKIKIICCNPDVKIRSEETVLHVMGYYAHEIQKDIPQKIHWYGKPYKNFSDYVEIVLKQHNITPNKRVIFFDDNIQNVVNMQNDIGIFGCWVKKTGIFHLENKNELIKKYGTPSSIVDSINLESNITLS
tara:strand:- start:509 stop:1357 length:849 start_codon:yes stop_codon:yes gene_type:complete